MSVATWAPDCPETRSKVLIRVLCSHQTDYREHRHSDSIKFRRNDQQLAVYSMETSTLITLIYFCANLVFLVLLALYIVKTGEHHEAKSLGKDIWNQRKIYAPMLVHFYDTATDLGVVYYWYTLMIDEQNGKNYESIDMEIFFWCGITFLLFYRVVLFFFLLAQIVSYGELSDAVRWYDPLLVVVELYVFRTVYLSYIDNEDKIKANIERRKSANKHVEVQIAHSTSAVTLEGAQSPTAGVSQVTPPSENIPPSDDTSPAGVELPTETMSPSEIKPESSETSTTNSHCFCPRYISKLCSNNRSTEKDSQKEKDMEPITVGGLQMITMFMESIGESLPQIMLQSVFIIRSYNDPDLQGTEIWLLLVSVFASLLSITDKFLKLEDEFQDEQSLYSERAAAPKFTSFSKGLCLNADTMWYTLRVLWRLFHTTSGLVVYTLIWTVMGGAWLPIFCSFLHLLYCGFQYNDDPDCGILFLIPLGHFGGLLEFRWFLIVVKWCQVVFGLILIAVFASTEFECGICADSVQRSFANEDEYGTRNHRIAIYYALGCVSFLAEFVLFWVMACAGIIEPTG